MLSKLLKYDLKWIYKAVIVFYALSLIFALIGRGLSLIENSLLFAIISKVCYGIVIAMLISAMINNLMRVWARVVKNMYKDESYLTHTLPIEKSKIYLSKFLAAIITMFTTVLVSAICLAICYYSQENIEFLKSMLEIAATTYNSSVIGLLISILFVFFLEMVFILMVGVEGIIIGHKSNNLKIVKSIVIGLVIYMILSSISIGILFVAGLLNSDIMSLFNNVEVSSNTLKIMMLVGILVYALYNLGIYFIGKKLLNKGVDVD